VLAIKGVCWGEDARVVVQNTVGGVTMGRKLQLLSAWLLAAVLAVAASGRAQTGSEAGCAVPPGRTQRWYYWQTDGFWTGYLRVNAPNREAGVPNRSSPPAYAGATSNVKRERVPMAAETPCDECPGQGTDGGTADDAAVREARGRNAAIGRRIQAEEYDFAKEQWKVFMFVEEVLMTIPALPLSQTALGPPQTLEMEIRSSTVSGKSKRPATFDYYGRETTIVSEVPVTLHKFELRRSGAEPARFWVDDAGIMQRLTIGDRHEFVLSAGPPTQPSLRPGDVTVSWSSTADALP
jgi:hypothetical protein